MGQDRGVFRRRKSTEPDLPPEQIFTNLRTQILDLEPSSVGITAGTGFPRVWGALMETGYPNAVASVVSLVDGTTSLYTSSGFGIIGGGAHPDVVVATAAFLAAVEQSVEAFGDDHAAALPTPGETIIRALTHHGRRAVRGSEEDFVNRRHPQSSVFYAGQDVLTELRLIHEADEA
jgi:hypothetical protein